MIDGQYKTYNPTKYANTWSYRPTTLEEMYNECSGSTVNKENEVEDNLTITFNGVKDARNQLKYELPRDNYGSATIKGNTITITKDGDTTTGISGIFDPSEDNLYNRLTDMKNKYGYEAISDIVKVGSLWFVVLKLNK